MSQRRINWDKIKTEYVTGDLSQEKLAKKHKVNVRDLADHCRKEKWVEQRKNYRVKVAEKTEEKIANRKANQLAGLLDASFALSNTIKEAVADPDQFNRYIVTKGEKGGEFWTEEEIFNKKDTKAIRDLVQSMKTLESLIRSLHNIPTEAEAQRLRIEREKFELEKEKWEKEKAEKSSAHEVRVVFDTEDLEGWTE